MPIGPLQDDAHVLAAVALHQLQGAAVRVRGIGIAPLHQREQRKRQIAALAGQPILMASALPFVAVRKLFENLMLDQAGQPLRQNFARHAKLVLHRLEPRHAIERLAQHEHGPAVADLIERADQGAIFGGNLRH